LKGNLLNFKLAPGAHTLGECLSKFDLSTPHNERHGILHLHWSVATHDNCAATYTEHAQLPDGSEDPKWRLCQGRIPYRTHMGHPGDCRDDLWQHMVKPFANFATAIFRRTVPSCQQHEAKSFAQVIPGHPWSYASFSVYADSEGTGDLTKNLHATKLQSESNVTAEGESRGLGLHEDDKNISFTVVLVMGVNLQGFDQLYPTAGVRVPCGCWAYASANAANLLHAVAKGRGFRVAFVYAVHADMALGYDTQGKPILGEWLRTSRS
jgi:hypothetical protein